MNPRVFPQAAVELPRATVEILRVTLVLLLVGEVRARAFGVVLTL